VKSGQTVTVQYTGVIWPGGKVFDSSWVRGTPAQFPIGVGKVISGWDEALVGKTVGSEILIVVPPDKGYGAAGNAQAGIKGTDTLVFVVDILDAA
jgi:peptidylprolyl isomerase